MDGKNKGCFGEVGLLMNFGFNWEFCFYEKDGEWFGRMYDIIFAFLYVYVCKCVYMYVSIYIYLGKYI